MEGLILIVIFVAAVFLVARVRDKDVGQKCPKCRSPDFRHISETKPDAILLAAFKCQRCGYIQHRNEDSSVDGM